MPAYPSGGQFEISHGDQRATIVEVGGGIREYTDGQRPVLDPYPVHAMCDGARGTPLIPWPNRLDDGRYSFGGHEYQLPITEPERGNAIHGLLRWRNWSARERAPDSVVMATRLHPMPGWPFLLDVSIAYTLRAQGLTVTTTVVNAGSVPSPFGYGQHPYLSPGADAAVDGCALQLGAATRILTDPARQLPTGREAVAETAFDFRYSRPIRDLRIDDPFTDLVRDHDGRARVRLDCPDGRAVELWCDDTHTVIQLYTGDTLDPARRRRGLAAEPMTCPPNALHSGEGLISLAPGESHVCRWGVGLR